MKINTFLINMKNSHERLQFMSKQLNVINMDFTIQEGIDGQTYDFENIYDDLSSRKNNEGNSMSKGQLGCALSHKKIYERMIAENLDYSLVLEDDIDLPKNFKQIIEEEIIKRKSQKTKWDYLSFSYPQTGWQAIISRVSSIIKTSKEIIRDNKSLIKLFSFYIKTLAVICLFTLEGMREFLYMLIFKYGKASNFYRPLYLAGCYLVNKEGAEKLLAVNEKIIYAADRLPNIARIKTNLKFYAFVPLLVQQRKIFESLTYK